MEYNDVLKKYRWTDSSGYATQLRYATKSEAICAAWGRFLYREENKESYWKKVEN
jgi:hypothetical protein